MKNIVQRTITGVLFVAILLIAIIAGNIWYYLLFLLLSSLCLVEFYKSFKAPGTSPQIVTGTITGMLLFTAGYLHASGNLPFIIYLALIPAYLIIQLSEIYRKKQTPLKNLHHTFFGIIYVALPFALLSYIAHEKSGIYNPVYILALFTFTWVNDTGAYLSGITLGKHPLFKRLSPKKSWEGAIGGIIFTLVAAWIYSTFFSSLSLTGWIGFAILTALSSIYGDFAESLYKRNLKIKDSGKLLPGHGGMLDRLDSVLLGIPVTFVYLQLLTYFKP